MVTATVNWTPVGPGVPRPRAVSARFSPVAEFEFQTLQTWRLFGDGLDVLLKADLLRRGQADHLLAAQVGRAPDPARPRMADIVPQQRGFEPQLGRLRIRRVCSAPGWVTETLDRRERERRRGEVPERMGPGQLRRASRRWVWTRSPGFLGIRKR